MNINYKHPYQQIQEPPIILPFTPSSPVEGKAVEYTELNYPFPGDWVTGSIVSGPNDAFTNHTRRGYLRRFIVFI